eukprot:GHVL01018554.1.p1 GENE.GHVL01018554.1~~GHVL01018554.1.p1  ORF type:complete len:371 (+),score=43.09 GHVL01018554.1:40-1152(+)
MNKTTKEKEAGDGAVWFNNSKVSGGLLGCRQTIGPLLLMTIIPHAAIFVWWSINHTYNIQYDTIFTRFLNDYPSPFNFIAWKIIGIFMLLQLILTRIIPCKMYLGAISATGYRNQYHSNGVLCYLITIIGYIILSYYNIIDGCIIYDYYGNCLTTLIIWAFFFCFILYLKGVYSPSSKDCGTTGNIIFDFFFGSELYPNILGWDVKQFTNCRFGLMWWGLALISFSFAQIRNIGRISDCLLVSVILQLIYLLKFYYWETGYFNTMDIQHDRAGFYICWGCLVFVPAFYTSGSQFLTSHPIDLGLFRTIVTLVFGLTMIWVNYDCDRQRQKFRETNGKCLIWGKKPVKITAHYKTEDGSVKQSILLASGNR